MKLSISILAIACALGIAACTNQPDQKTETAGMKHDSMDMGTDTSMMQTSGISAAMDKMMTEMHQMKMTGNVDADFAMMMKCHHQGAVDMAQAELKSGTDEKLKAMAQKIIDAQKAEISALDNFLNANKASVKNYDAMDKDKGFGKMMDKNMSMMMDMPKSGSESADIQFVNMMIPHHQSAVYMAEGFIQSGKDVKLITMAKKIIADQNKEIDEFKAIQSTLK